MNAKGMSDGEKTQGQIGDEARAHARSVVEVIRARLAPTNEEVLNLARAIRHMTDPCPACGIALHKTGAEGCDHGRPPECVPWDREVGPSVAHAMLAAEREPEPR